MELKSIHDKARIEKYLEGRKDINFYMFGDLDPFFWEKTIWYALEDENQNIKSLCLVYFGELPALPVVLLICKEDEIPVSKKLLERILPMLPDEFYTHLTVGIEDVLTEQYNLSGGGLHYKMALKHDKLLLRYDTDKGVQLQEKDTPELIEFYKKAYPNSWFNPIMLLTDKYFGLRNDEGELLSVAGVHVFSEQYGVAALGNITTRPELRGQGLAKHITAILCQNLFETVDVIGLNVVATNQAALSTYKALGFEHICRYNEFIVEKKKAQ